MKEEIHQSIIEIAEETNGEKALKILYMAAYFARAKSMHLDMFLCLYNDIEEELDAAILLLKKKSLIELQNEQAFFVTNIVQKEIRTFLKQNGKEITVLTDAIDLQFFHLVKDEIHPNYVDHALSLLSFVRESDELIKRSLGLPSHIVTALIKHNKLREASVFGKMALKFLEKSVGEAHPETLTLHHNLATVLHAEGQHEKAVKVLQELNKKDLKYSTVKEITESLVPIAKGLCEQSKYKDALAVYEILIGGKKVMDTFDSEIITAWHDYALLLSDMGRYSEAIDILQDLLLQKDIVLQKREVFTDDNKYGFLTRHALSSVYSKQGNCIQAMKQLKEVLSESQKYSGELHLDTLRAERDIGTVLLLKGEYEEALKTFEDVEKKYKKIFPESHLAMLCTRANAIAALVGLKRYDSALELSEDVCEAYKNAVGERHYETLTVKWNIGSILLEQGKLKEAVKVFRDVFEGFNDIFGPEHHKTVKAKAVLEMWSLGALHVAALKGDLNVVVSLVENNEDLNMEDSKRRRPLHYAAKKGHIHIAKYLIKMGAMYNAEDFKNVTPQQLAACRQMKDLLLSVNNLFRDVKRGVQVDIASHREWINAKDKNGYTLLRWAVCNSHKCIVQQLVDTGADTKCISLKGNTPLHVASSKGYKGIAEILLQSVTGNDLSDLLNSKTTSGGNTALHVAAENNDLDMVKCLLMYGAICDIRNKNGQSPVQLSTDHSTCDLLMHFKCISLKGNTPLHVASSKGYKEMAEILLQSVTGNDLSDLNSKTTSEDNTARHVAADGAIYGIQNKNDKSPVQLSTAQSTYDLLMHFKRICLKENIPLQATSPKSYQEISEILLQSVTGNNLSHLLNSEMARGGNTALHVAAENNDIDLVKCLLMYGAIYDIRNKNGQSPVQLSTDQSICDLLFVIHNMFRSVSEGNSETVSQLKSMCNEEFLVVSKARNSQRHTLLQVAIKNKHREIIHGLLELLKDENRDKVN